MRVAIIHMKQLEYALHTKLHADDVIDDCNTQLKLLSTIAESQPQAAYLTFVSGFRSKLNFFYQGCIQGLVWAHWCYGNVGFVHTNNTS